MNKKLTFHVGVEGAVKAAKGNDLVIIIDALRATSTIVSLLDKGVKAVKPLQYSDSFTGRIIGEKNGSKIDGCHFNNSPTELSKIRFSSDEIVGIKTTNGTRCILSAKTKKNDVLIGAALNAKACAVEAQSISEFKDCNISIVLAGRRGKLSEEDLYVGSIIYNFFTAPYDVLGTIEPSIPDNLHAAILKTDAASNLKKLGHQDDIRICASINNTRVVPYFDGNLITPRLTYCNN